MTAIGLNGKKQIDENLRATYGLAQACIVLDAALFINYICWGAAAASSKKIDGLRQARTLVAIRLPRRHGVDKPSLDFANNAFNQRQKNIFKNINFLFNYINSVLAVN